MVELFPAKAFPAFRKHFIDISRWGEIPENNEEWAKKPKSRDLCWLAYSPRDYQHAFNWWEIDEKIYFSVNLSILNNKRILNECLWAYSKPVKSIKVEAVQRSCLSLCGIVSKNNAEKIIKNFN